MNDTTKGDKLRDTAKDLDTDNTPITNQGEDATLTDAPTEPCLEADYTLRPSLHAVVIALKSPSHGTEQVVTPLKLVLKLGWASLECLGTSYLVVAILLNSPTRGTA